MAPSEAYRDPFSMPMPDGHFAILGRFLISCAQIESTVHLVARMHAGGDEEISRFLIGQPRVRDLLATIAGLRRIRGYDSDQVDRFAELRRTLDHIFNVRNVIAHQCPAWREGWLRYDRSPTSREISDRAKLIYVVKLEELANLAQVCRMAERALFNLSTHKEEPLLSSEEAMQKIRSFCKDHPLPPNPT